MRITVPAHGRTLASLPFVPDDPSIGALLHGAPPGIGRVRSWDAASQMYVTFTRRVATVDQPETWTSDAAPLVPELWPGEAFWIENDGDQPASICLQGEVCLEESVEAVLLPGLNGIGYPFAGAAEFRATSLAALGDLSGGLVGWNSTAAGSADESSWSDVTALAPGVGYFFAGSRAESAIWSEPRPYDAPFPRSGEPAIESVTVSPYGGEGALTLRAPAGVPLDLFVQELTEGGAFSATNNWLVAGSVTVPNEGTSATTQWRDFGVYAIGRPQSAATLGCVYLAARADIDSDGDGLPDARESFIHHTSPERKDSDGDGMPDGWEIANGLDPLRDDAKEDRDADGVRNAEELAQGTSARYQNRANVVLYVDAKTGNDENDGLAADTRGASAPKRTINAAFRVAIPGDNVMVAEGIYTGPVIVPGGVRLWATGRVHVQ